MIYASTIEGVALVWACVCPRVRDLNRAHEEDSPLESNGRIIDLRPSDEPYLVIKWRTSGEVFHLSQDLQLSGMVRSSAVVGVIFFSL